MYVQFKRTEKCTAFVFLVGDREILRFEKKLFFIMNSCNNHILIFFAGKLRTAQLCTTD